MLDVGRGYKNLIVRALLIYRACNTIKQFQCSYKTVTRVITHHNHYKCLPSRKRNLQKQATSAEGLFSRLFNFNMLHLLLSNKEKEEMGQKRSAKPGQ